MANQELTSFQIDTKYANAIEAANAHYDSIKAAADLAEGTGADAFDPGRGTGEIPVFQGDAGGAYSQEYLQKSLVGQAALFDEVIEELEGKRDSGETLNIKEEAQLASATAGQEA